VNTAGELEGNPIVRPSGPMTNIYCPANNRIHNISVRISKGLLYNSKLIIIFALFKNNNILEMISFSNDVK
jgi:hypothetical protein